MHKHKVYSLSNFESESSEVQTSEQKVRYMVKRLSSFPANSRYVSKTYPNDAEARKDREIRIKLIAGILQHIKSGFLAFDPSVIHQGTTHNLAGWIELTVLQSFSLFGTYRPEYAYQSDPPFWTSKGQKSQYSPLITDKYRTTAKYETLGHPINRWCRDFCGLTHGEASLLFSSATNLQLIEATVNLLSQGYRLKGWAWFVQLTEREYQLRTYEESGIIFDLSPEGLAIFKSAFTKEEL